MASDEYLIDPTGDTMCSMETESSPEEFPKMELSEFDSGSHDKCLPTTRCLTLNDMPEEILEHILGFLSPYKEMEIAKLVSKQWHRVIQSVVKQKKRRFLQSLSKCDVQWTEIFKDKQTSLKERGRISITDRFSHSAAYHDGFMYVFGGCTSTSTTFNDLWSFDLTHRKWVRPVAMGTYPSPKACATMVVYEGNLVLFGGWSYPIPHPLHQSAHHFSELHMYSPSTNRWSYVHSLGQEPEARGCHSASVVGHLMVVFGGLPRPGVSSNSLWIFDFHKSSWTQQPVAGDAIPEPRYGQFQATLDDRHILIMGGCILQNRINRVYTVYTDVWLLTLEPSSPWRWTKLTVECPELGAPQTWCHAACKVNDLVVVVAKSNTQRHTKVIKRPRRKRRKGENKSGNLPVLPSSASSSSSPSGTGASEKSHPTFNPTSSTVKSHGVYIHPKLQPQPKRGAATLGSDLKGIKPASPNSDTVEQTSRGASATVDRDVPEALKEAAATGQNDGQSSNDPEKTMSILPQCTPSLPQCSASSVPESHLGMDPGSSRSVAESPSASFSSSTTQREPGCPVAPSTPSQSNSLLALQQRLHRECLNLPDPDNHHHNSRYSRRHSGGLGQRGWGGHDDMDHDGVDDDDDNVPEGYLHRLHNRWMGEQAPGENRAPSQSPASPQVLSLSQDDPTANSVSSEQSQHLESSGAAGSGASPSQDTDYLTGSSRAGENMSNSNSMDQPSGSLQPQPHQQPHLQQPNNPLQVNGSRPFQPRAGRGMPSIRPNASSNRQRQLEALQRQEELLRSKSRALAAARGIRPQPQLAPSPPQENVPAVQRHQQENNIPEGAEAAKEVEPIERKDESNSRNDHGAVNNHGFNNHKYDHKDSDDDYDDDDDPDPTAPTQIPSKNKMDVHVLDISRAVSEHVVRWGPLSELQPPSAPDETLLCSLVEGRGELALFGGVRRDLSLAGANANEDGVSQTAVSKLYLLEPG